MTFTPLTLVGIVLIAAVISYAATPLVISLALKLNLIDDPHTNKHPKVTHKTATPRGGGLAIYSGFLIASIMFLPFDSHLLGIILGGGILVILGLFDDKWNLSPYLRLLVQIIAASLPVLFGIGIAFISNPFNGILDLSHPQVSFTLLGEVRTIWILSDLFAVFWLVFLMNMLNMGAKGLPGQLSGVSAIAALTIALISLQYSADITEWPVLILALITAGAFLGHLPWNISPQRIMPSFGGSTFAGYMLGVLSILSTAKVGTLLVVLGIPIVDTTYTIIRRILSGKSPFWGDRGHLHHKLLDSGMTRNNVTYTYWFMTALLGALALNLNASQKLYTIVGVILLIGSVLLALTITIRTTSQK